MTSRASAGLLTVAEGCVGQEAGAAEAAEVGKDDPVALRRQHRRHVDVAVDVIGPAVQKKDDRTAGGPVLGIPYVEHARIDRLERLERRSARRRRRCAHRRRTRGQRSRRHRGTDCPGELTSGDHGGSFLRRLHTGELRMDLQVQDGRWFCGYHRECASCRISAARSPMITQGAWGLPVVARGMMDPSAIRRPSTPYTLSDPSTIDMSSVPSWRCRSDASNWWRHPARTARAHAPSGCPA